MWNLFKSDVYRLFHSRYFQVLVLLYFASVALMVSAGMVEANNGLVSFDYKTTPFSEYLCFLPLNVLFGFFVFLSYVMLLSDEHQKGYVKNLYPYFQKKWKISTARIMTFIMIWFLYLVIGIAYGFFWIGCIEGRWGSIDGFGYVMFVLAQLLVASLIALVISLVIHLAREKVIPIIFLLLYSSGGLWALGLSLISFIGWDPLRFSEYNPYYMSHTLRAVWDTSTYGHLFCVSGIFTLIVLVANILVLQKKDL